MNLLNSSPSNDTTIQASDSLVGTIGKPKLKGTAFPKQVSHELKLRVTKVWNVD